MTAPSLETSARVKRAVEGDRESLEWVIAHVSPLVEAQVRVRLGHLANNAADVDDLVAEVWAVALRKIGKLRPREGHYAPVLAKYLATTARNLTSNFVRQAERHKAAPLEVGGTEESTRRIEKAILDETRTILTRVAQSEASALIRAALARLGEQKRQVLILRLLENKTNQEIAELLHLKPNTVAVRYSRALEELRKYLLPGIFPDM